MSVLADIQAFLLDSSKREQIDTGDAVELLGRVASQLESDNASNNRRDEEDCKLQDIGRSAAASLSEMVAALECDYDRLEELALTRHSRVNVRAHTSEPGKGLTYPALTDVELLGDCPGNTHDVVDVEDSEGNEISVYCFSITHADEAEAKEYTELKEAAGDCTSREDAEQRIQEDPLSVQVRSDWYTPGETPEPAEYEILLSTGGPATRIIGELDQHMQPSSARLQVQDWFEPWTDYRGNDAMPWSAVSELCLTYAQQFYFGEG